MFAIIRLVLSQGKISERTCRWHDAINKKSRYTLFTYDEAYAQACRHFYSKTKGLRTSLYVEQIDQETGQNVYYVTYQQQTNNYHTGAPIWCQIQ